ncbi:hypothetical protein [Azospirillum baldaniorum]|uniref:hypothetical protein n=1 Tax=Azospirillum baldaniorum TaxID=1064539 RepID=UPI00117C8278|nr:hypothetical protein [Azospirillum baldaniorum]
MIDVDHREGLAALADDALDLGDVLAVAAVDVLPLELGRGHLRDRRVERSVGGGDLPGRLVARDLLGGGSGRAFGQGRRGEQKRGDATGGDDRLHEAYSFFMPCFRAVEANQSTAWLRGIFHAPRGYRAKGMIVRQRKIFLT